MIARTFRVWGRVQGVSFRATTALAARRVGARGWVRNLPDGTVEGWAEGDPDAVAALLDFVHDGPPHARVDRVAVEDAAPEGHAHFEVRR